MVHCRSTDRNILRNSHTDNQTLTETHRNKHTEREELTHTITGWDDFSVYVLPQSKCSWFK